MIWLLIEAGIALAILIGIVWWTLPRQPRAADQPAEDARKEKNKDATGDR